MKRILHVAVTLTGEGIANYLYNYLTNLSLEKYEIDVAINYSENVGIYEDILKEKGINILKIHSYENSTKLWMKDLDSLMKEKKYDIVEAHVGVRSVFVCKLAKKNNIFSRIVHAHIAYEPENILKKIVRKTMYSVFKKNITTYFGCSKEALDWTYGKNCKRKPSYVINNAIDAEKFIYSQNNREKCRVKYDLENNFVIGCVGRLCYQKNQEFLIDIFLEIIKEKSNAKLLLIGDGPNKSMLEAKCKENNVVDKVIFAGIINNVNEMLSAMDCFVLPSRYEGFGIVYLEAQLNGLPTFATEEKVPKVACVSNNMKFISEKKSPAEWAECIIENAEKRNKSIVHVEDFDINKQAKKLEEIYDCILVGDQK